MAFDVVIIGAGHNGLTAAAYLGKAGYSVKVVEARSMIGGAAVTEEFHPGFRNSVCSYTVSLLNPKVIQDLDLARHGLRIIERPMSNFLPLEGDALSVWPDTKRWKEEVARLSPGDAANLDAYSATLERLAGVLRGLILETPPNIGGTLADLWRGWRQSKPVRALDRQTQQDLIDIFTMSAADFLARYFRHDAILALYAFDGIVGTLASPYAPGTAYVLLHHCFGEVNGKHGVWGHAIGGMGAISDAMAAAAREGGVEIEVDAPVAEVLTESGQAKGVRLVDGREIHARKVAANVNPKTLFGDLLDPAELPADFRTRMSNWRCKSGTMRMNVALRELPDFLAAPGSGQQLHHTAGIIMAPDMAYMETAYSDARHSGFSKQPVVEMLIPSTIDDTLAPPGQHVASLFCQHFEYDLPDGQNWDDLKDKAIEAVIATVTGFAPNFRDSILAVQALTPLDLERDFGLTGGDIFHGTLDLNQIFSLRPAMGHADYRMPVAGLYLCGSGAHPGGGVTGAPGHNAAREMIRDFRRRR
ncbi:MAG TPA: NAD(P)/FAD-dependent oxidoreductase [Aliiroseovarius sp.]|nr:NAD(P)/FAD-dependent oxidoreductase [Aliiroseovarius sp.]